MSFADPQTLTIAPASAVSLPRTSVGDDTSEYASGDGLLQLVASHNYGKQRTRRMLRVNTSKVTSDPFKPAENRKVSMSYYIVFDLDPTAYTAAEALAVFAGFNTQITASSNLLITKLLGGES
nr:MAG: hypothetical protein 2 [Leviviridae sp.]